MTVQFVPWGITDRPPQLPTEPNAMAGSAPLHIGHAFSAQLILSTVGPEQLRPPFDGEGRVQFLDLVFVPASWPGILQE